MGYTTDFDGEISIEPPLDAETKLFLEKFNETRRMKRTKGPDYVGGTGYMGQNHDADVTDHNNPPEGQPGLWCHWRPTEDGTALEWDYGEKFYFAPKWMEYIINRYLIPKGHVCNGEIEAQGENPSDVWLLKVVDNVVTVHDEEDTIDPT